MEKTYSNDQHYDGFWSDYRVNLLIITPLHNASCWRQTKLSANADKMSPDMVRAKD